MKFLTALTRKHVTPPSTTKDSWKTALENATGNSAIKESSKRTLYLLLDCSGSMNDAGKLDSAKRGASAFCHDAATKSYAIGLIGFSHEAVILREAAEGTNGIDEALYGLPASGSTDMTGALLMAGRKLKSKPGQRTVCLVTDGMPNDRASAIKAAVALQTSGVEIMALGTDDADKSFLDQIVTSKELSVKVPRQELQQGLAKMALLLPG